MSYIHPAALEHLRKRWERPDAYRFAAPGTPEAVPPWERPETKARWAAERDALKRAAFERELFDLRRDWEELKREIAAKREAERREVEELRIKSDLAFENFRRAFKSYAQQRKYSPDQPRVPAGNPDGGQWTSGGGEGAGRNDPTVLSDATADNVFEPGTRLAADNSAASYRIDLQEEEARGGHAISAHVNRSPEALMAQARENFDRNPNARESRSGSFSSLEAATKLVNSTLAQNRDMVDRVATGELPRTIVFAQFSSVTGIEAVIPRIHSQPYFRETYGVGVIIVHDQFSSHGYRVLTAFPNNR
jgi:CDI toxin RNase A-like protein